jgi:hypothetical protein
MMADGHSSFDVDTYLNNGYSEEKGLDKSPQNGSLVPNKIPEGTY